MDKIQIVHQKLPKYAAVVAAWSLEGSETPFLGDILREIIKQMCFIDRKNTFQVDLIRHITYITKVIGKVLVAFCAQSYKCPTVQKSIPNIFPLQQYSLLN